MNQESKLLQTVQKTAVRKADTIMKRISEEARRNVIKNRSNSQNNRE